MVVPPELEIALEAPTLADVFQARKVVYQHLKPTPLLRHSALSQLTGAEIFVKCENLLPTGAFKVRGGLNLVSRLTDEEKKRGVITASTGNHGQSVAYAARAYGVKAIIAAPQGNNPYKLKAMRNLGAEVVEVGKDFDEAREWAGEEAARQGYRFIHSGDEPYLIAGVATGSLELIEEVPDLDYILVPVGGGSGACGHCIAAKGVNPQVQVIGVQSEHAPAVYQTYKSHKFTTTPTIQTFAEGIATRVPFALPYKIMQEKLDDMVLVTDDELRQAIRIYLETIHQVAEGAGAAPLAAALRYRERFAGKKVALIISGGNLTLDTLKQILTEK
ncbi:MAG TPA: threonine dehydratase [Chloroflexia bacterium]|nr:threonine dehydratase [Chloroflexia bacterium]